MPPKGRMSIRDSRWLCGVQPPLPSTNEQALSTAEESPEDFSRRFERELRVAAGLEESKEIAEREGKADETKALHLCTSCDIHVETEERDTLREHYSSGWHHHNVRRRLRGKPAVTEQQWEERLEDDDSNGQAKKIIEEDDESGSEEEESISYDNVNTVFGAARTFFSQNNEVFSAYAALLLDGESETSSTPSFFLRSLDCAVLLFAGGHFAAGIFKGDKLAAHRTLRRYVVRAKQGGAQSQNDKSKGNAKSAGANLRRYNEQVLKDEIRELLVKDWAALLTETPLVFIRCASYQRSLFIGDEGVFAKNDQRLRSIPFETKRPTLEEVQRTWERLAAVEEHGSIQEFRAALEERREKLERKVTAPVKKLRKDKDGEFRDVEEDKKEDEYKRKQNEERRMRKEEALKEVAVQKKAEDEWAGIPEVQRQAVYATVRMDEEGALQKMLEELSEVDKDQMLRYIRDVRLPPSGNSLLHIAAKKGQQHAIMSLLVLGVDAASRNSEGLVPYNLAETKQTRAVFTAFRAKNEKAADWRSAQIPPPPAVIELTEEEKQRQAEKKKAKRDKTKAKQKQKKEAEKKETEEQARRDAYLKLSDREKRALAAEARLAALPSISRCFQCGSPLPSPPFEYSANRFCSPKCVAVHRSAKGTPLSPV